MALAAPTTGFALPLLPCWRSGLTTQCLIAGLAMALCELCGDHECDVYDELSPVTNLGPPENDWDSASLGFPPPGSASTRSKREMLGGYQYGTFESVHEGRKATESSIPFAYRDVPWEPGAAFRSPGPDPTAHYLVLNADLPVGDADGGKDEFDEYSTHDGSRLSSTGQRLPYARGDGRIDRASLPSAEPYDALHGIYSGRHESINSAWTAGTRPASERELANRAGYLEWPPETDPLFQISNFTLELWVNPAPEQEAFAGLAGTLFSSGPIHSGWGLMLQRERMPSPRTSAFGRAEGGDARGGGARAGRQMPVTSAGWEAVPAGMSSLHFVVCDSSLDLPGRIDPEVSLTDLVLAEPYALIPHGVWTHVAAAYDSFGGSRLFINGSQVEYIVYWSQVE
jgi:hypothetical protein